MGLEIDVVGQYNAGAVTALANMAELGASKEAVLEVGAIMDISFDDIDESDHEKLINAYGVGFETKSD